MMIFVYVCFFAYCLLSSLTFADGSISVLPFKNPTLIPHQSLPGSNPQAPQGGALHLGANGAEYTTLNPFLFKGVPAASAERLYATLMYTPLEDLGVAYPYVAEGVHIDRERTCITFDLDSDATFEDKTPITGEDVLFSLRLLQRQGTPEYRLHYKDVLGTILPNGSLRFSYVDGKPFSQDTLFLIANMPLFSHKNPNLASGPYRVLSATRERLTYQRQRPWWGDKRPLFRGLYNFDQIVFHYFSNPEAAFLAFQKHNLDARFEERALTWKKKYTFQAVDAGQVHLQELPPPYALGYNGLFFNLSKAPLTNIFVRQALILALDFDWINDHLLCSSYQRNQTLFLGLSHQPLQLVHNRKDLGRARQLLEKAGCTWEKGICLWKQKPLTLTLILNRPGSLRLFSPYQSALKDLGIRLNLQLVDSAHFIHAKHKGDYDILLETKGPHLSAGGYMADWQTIQDPLVLKALHDMRAASSKTAYQRATQDLDKALYEGAYFVPLWHRPLVYVAHWSPIQLPSQGRARAVFDRWWHA